MRLRSFGIAAVAFAALAPACEPACAPTPPPPAPAPAPAPAPVPEIVSIVINGQGNGHGRGLSQWGAYGAAVNLGWTYQQILDHYYGGTLWGNRSNESIGIRLMALDGSSVTNVVSSTASAVWNGYSYPTLQALEVGEDVYDVWGATTAVCPGTPATWTLLGDNVPGPITFTTPADQTTTTPNAVLGVCQPDGSVIHYRGSITAVNEPATGANRTVNNVLVENYLRGVLPREVPASWGNSANGMHSLWAMAVAARSFAISQNRYPSFGAKTCDTAACQVYGGSAYRPSATSAYTVREHPNTDRAAAETAGWVRVWPGDRIVSAEYSATHGPRSAGGQFPPVDDSHSNVPQNSLYTWVRTVDAATLEATYALGDLIGAYTERDPGSPYDGNWGNRVVLQGSAQTVVVPGLTFRNTMGFPSHGYVVAGLNWSG